MPSKIKPIPMYVPPMTTAAYIDPTDASSAIQAATVRNTSPTTIHSMAQKPIAAFRAARAAAR